MIDAGGSIVHVNPRDVEGVRAMLAHIGGDEAEKASVRAINRTMTGVRTDGIRILSEHYALTASAIRESWHISRARFRDPCGVVGSRGTFIRLSKFGARQTKTGVSVKVLRRNPRAVVAHAFIARVKSGQRDDQVYWRQYKGPRKRAVTGRAYARMPFEYRFPVKALYGPRIQDHLGDPAIIEKLTRMAGERLSKDMKHEVEYLLSQVR